MSKERYRHGHQKPPENNPSNRQSQSPYSQFRHYENRLLRAPVKDIVEAATDLMKYATEESYDCYHVLRALHLGLRLLSEKDRRNAGQIILDGIEQYFSIDEILFKGLIPDGMEQVLSRDKIFKELRILFDDTTRQNSEYPYRFKTENRPLGSRTLYFLKGMGDLINDSEQDKDVYNKSKRSILTLRPIKVRLSDNEELKKDITTIIQSRHTVILTVGNKILEGKYLEIPETVLTNLLSADHGVNNYSTIGRKYNGVSLIEVLNEGDITKRLLKLMDFVSGLPKGDLFWRYFLEGTFFMYQVHGTNPEFKHPKISEFVFLNQWFLAESFYYSQLKEQEGLEADYSLDEGFSRLFSNLNLDLTDRFIHSMHLALTHIPMTMSFLRDNSLPEVFQQFPEINLLLAYYKKITDGENKNKQFLKSDQPEAILYDEIVPWYLRTHTVDLLENWQRRFKLQSGKFALLAQLLKEAAISEEEIKKLFTEELISSIERRLGKIFFEKLAQKEDDIKITSDRVIDYFKSDRRLKYWPNSKTFHEIRFDENTLPNIMGFENIYFIVPDISDMPTKPIVFIMQMTEPRIAIKGEIDPNLDQNNQMKLSVDLRREHSSLETLVRSIVVSSFHDLVLRESLRQTTSATPIKSNEGKLVQTDETNTKPKKQAPTRLPRKRRPSILEKYDQTGKVEITTSSNLTEEIASLISFRENKTFTPRRVDVYTRDLHGAVEYYDSIIRFDQGKATPDEVENLRKAMFKMSPIKRQTLDQLPERLRNSMRRVSDPITGETIYLNTWVVEHVSPKPTDEEKVSPAKFHERFYRVGSPQLPFLDSLVALLIDEVKS